MTVPHRSRSRLIVAVATAILIAGCSAAQAPVSLIGTLANVSKHDGPLAGASAEVDIQNDWIAPIAGFGSYDCWTISPGLPIVGAGDIARPITLTHRTSPFCGIPSSLAITYGRAATTGEKCTSLTAFNVQVAVRVPLPPNVAEDRSDLFFTHSNLIVGVRNGPTSRAALCLRISCLFRWRTG